MSDESIPKPELVVHVPTAVKMAHMKESSRLWRLMITQLWVSVLLAMLLSFEASSNGITAWSEYTPFQQSKCIMTAIAAGLLIVKAFYSDAVSEYKRSKQKVNQEIENKLP